MSDHNSGLYKGGYLCNCGKVFPNGRTRDIHAGECPACNPPKSEGPYKFDEQKGGVIGPFGLEINTDDMVKDGNEVELLTIGFNEGRASLIPLVREMLDVIEYQKRFSFGGPGVIPTTNLTLIISKAKKEIGE